MTIDFFYFLKVYLSFSPAVTYIKWVRVNFFHVKWKLNREKSHGLNISRVFLKPKIFRYIAHHFACEWKREKLCHSGAFLVWGMTRIVPMSYFSVRCVSFPLVLEKNHFRFRVGTLLVVLQKQLNWLISHCRPSTVEAVWI